MRAYVLLVGGLACSSFASSRGDVPFQVHWQGWVEQGRIMQSSDTLQGPDRDPLFNNVINMDGTTMQSAGAQMTVVAELGDNWTGAFGIGAYRATHSIGRFNGSDDPAFFSVSLFKPYVPEAHLTYFRGDRVDPWFSLTAGNFSYKYNPDVKNLGMYLLRGPVYPGLLMSGFGEHDVDPTKAEHTGLHARHRMGKFEHNLLFVNERDLPPTFDWSVGYVAKYRPINALEIGAGVNFFRALPYDSELMTPGKLPGANPSSYEVTVRDTVVSGADTTVLRDTLFYTHQGTKLMAMFSLDLKPWISFPRVGEQDLRIYGEAALIGVKNYGSLYDDPMERIPVLLGVNLPSFGLLDLLSVEAEWYGTPYRNDLHNIGNPSSIVAEWMTADRPIPAPVPVDGEYKYATRDNWKWSVYAQKRVARHIQFTAQVANDHYRPAPVGTGAITMEGGTATATTAPRDWYFMGRIGFQF